MNTEQIKLKDDGEVYRGEKHIATVEDGGVKWEHWTLKKKHEEEVEALLTGDVKMEPIPPNPKINPEVQYKQTEAEPEPPMDYRGDISPGYPEWYLRANGQEAWDEKYIVRGRVRYTEKDAKDYLRANGSDPASSENQIPLNQ
jgi:hypothetical protein